MRENSLLEAIAKEYDLIVRTEHHVQIKLSNDKYHNFWPLYWGGLRVQFAGMGKSVIYNNADHLLKKLKGYNYSHSDYTQLQQIIKKTKGREEGIYCDAGFKQRDGKKISKLAVIRLKEDQVDLHVRTRFDIESNVDAEYEAILLATGLFWNESMIIYSDCESAVNRYVANCKSVSLDGKVQWIGRKENKEADKFANLRT